MADRFDTTRWSLVLHAGGSGTHARAALEDLCRIYRPPVLAYVRAHCRRSDEAEDLTQEFFAHLLERRIAARADRERGRFRAFLLTALRNFLASEHVRRSALVRGGGATMVELDDHAADSDEGPEQAFERAWAQTVLAEALDRLAEEAKETGKAELFRRLRPFLTVTPDAEEYAAIAAELGLRRNTLAVAVHRLRARLQEIVRAVLADTVDGGEAAEAEVRRWRDRLTGPGSV